MKTMLGWVFAIVLIAGATFFLIGPQRVWEMTVGDPDMGAMTLDSIQRTGKPNDALFVPPSFASTPDSIVVGTFAVEAGTLYTTLIARIEALGGVTWVEQNADARYARALTFSPMLRFPDTNHIWVTEEGDGTSGLALYAAAQMGTSDVGKNKARLESWLALLDDLPRTETP